MNCKKTFLALMLLLGVMVLAACRGPVSPEDPAVSDQIVETATAGAETDAQIPESEEDEQAPEAEKENQVPEAEKEEQVPDSEPLQQEEEQFTEEDAKALAQQSSIQKFGDRVADYGFRSCVADENGYTVTYAKGFDVPGQGFLYQTVTTIDSEGTVTECVHTHALEMEHEPGLVVETLTNDQILAAVTPELVERIPKILTDTMEISSFKYYEHETGYRLQLKIDYRFAVPDGSLCATTLNDYYVQ